MPGISQGLPALNIPVFLHSFSLPAATKKDTLSLSPQGLQSLKAGDQVAAISALKSVNGKPVKELKAVNNVLTLKDGEYYSFKMNDGSNMIVTGDSYRTIYPPYEDLAKEIGVDITDIAPETFRTYDEMWRWFLTSVNNGSLPPTDYMCYPYRQIFTKE